MNTYDVRVNLGGVAIIRVNADSEREAVSKVNETIENSTLRELNKRGRIIKSVIEVKEKRTNNREMER